MKFINNLQLTICGFAIVCLVVSCHNTDVKSGTQVSATDSASRHNGDTIVNKINYYTGIIASQPKNADAYWNRGKLEILNKSLTPALNDLTKAVILDSTKSGYFYNLADAE